MRLKPNAYKMLISKYKSMEIEELKANIEDWANKKNCSTQLEDLDLATKELELKYKERKEQIELLTKSLTSSSRVDRWIFSVMALVKQVINLIFRRFG